MPAFTRRQYAGAAAATTIAVGINTSETTCTLASTTGFPSSAGVPFYVVIDPGTSSEEKCSATISGSTLTITRAQDDTTASAHAAGATIYPVFTAKYAEDLGVDTSKLDVIRAKFAEDYLNETIDAVESGKYRVIVLDSIGSLSSRVEAEKEVGQKTVGTQASLMSVFVRKIAPQVSYNKILFIGINHMRTEIGTYGNPKIAMGGKTWSEKKKLSLRFRETGDNVTQGTDELGKPRVVGKWIEVKVEKNAVGATEKKLVRVPLILGKGFDAGANLLQQAIDREIFRKEGNTYYLLSEKIGTKAKLTEWMGIEENAERIKSMLV